MEIKVLGSVSPFCRLNRNCPGFLVTENKTKILLDCGNGSLGLLDPRKDLENLVVIISHLHHDHYGDLTSLANMSYVQHKLGYLKNKIKVYLPNDTRYKRVIIEGYEDLFGPCELEKLYLGDINASYMDIYSYDSYKPIVLDNQNIRIATKYTIHDIPCYAIRIDSSDGSLVYSADTGYRENFFQKFAQNVDLFICESSFLRKQEYNNLDNHHLCAYQAAMYANESNVGELMLTHFYPTINRNLYLKEAQELFENTILAKEGMVKKIGERL